MVYCITYDCSNKDADKKGVSFFRLPKDHKLRLTWFMKLRLVDPPNTDNVRVCSEQLTEECFVVDMQAAMGFKKTCSEDVVCVEILLSTQRKQPENTSNSYICLLSWVACVQLESGVYLFGNVLLC